GGAKHFNLADHQEAGLFVEAAEDVLPKGAVAVRVVDAARLPAKALVACGGIAASGAVLAADGRPIAADVDVSAVAPVRAPFKASPFDRGDRAAQQGEARWKGAIRGQAVQHRFGIGRWQLSVDCTGYAQRSNQTENAKFGPSPHP